MIDPNRPTARQISLIQDAWNIEGPAPKQHRAAKAKLRKEWPSLYFALEALSGDRLSDQAKIVEPSDFEVICDQSTDHVEYVDFNSCRSYMALELFETIFEEGL